MDEYYEPKLPPKPDGDFIKRTTGDYKPVVNYISKFNSNIITQSRSVTLISIESVRINSQVSIHIPGKGVVTTLAIPADSEVK